MYIPHAWSATSHLLRVNLHQFDIESAASEAYKNTNHEGQTHMYHHIKYRLIYT